MNICEGQVVSMSIQKLKNRIKKIEGEICGLGGSIPKEECNIIIRAHTLEETKKGFNQIRIVLEDKYGQFDESKILEVWVKAFGMQERSW